jgi:glutaryl-CoA dehydrogenase
MITTARETKDGWVLDGTKMWITNGSQATVSIIWAKTGDIKDSRTIRGFIVPTDTKGYTGKDQKGKLSLRASDTSEIHLQDVHLPKDAILPKSGWDQEPAHVPHPGPLRDRLGSDRGGDGVLRRGAPLRPAAVMFDRPIAQTQIQQVRLADMLTEITKAQLLALQLGRLKDAGTFTPAQVSLAKRNNVNMACEMRPRGPPAARRQRHPGRVSLDAAHGEPGVGVHVRRDA